MENVEHSCGDCKTWEEEIYWKCFSSRHFCFVLSSKEDDYRKKIDFPRKFWENMKSKVPDKLILQGPSGATFEVKVGMTHANLSLVDGWEEFVSSYSLKEGDILVMKFDGTPLIPVLIFSGGSHCEKESAYFFRKCSRHHHEAVPSAAVLESKKRKRELRVGTCEVDLIDKNNGGGNDSNVIQNGVGVCVDDDDDDEDDYADNDDDVGAEDDDCVNDEMEEAREENGGCESGGGGDSNMQQQQLHSSGGLKRKPTWLKKNLHLCSLKQKARKDNSNSGCSEPQKTPIITDLQIENQTHPEAGESSPILACPAPESSRGRPLKKSVSFSEGAGSKPNSSNVPSKVTAGRGRARKDGSCTSPTGSGNGKPSNLQSNHVTPKTSLDTTGERTLALATARAHAEVDSMSFVTTMKQSHVSRRFVLTVPTVWFAKHLRPKSQREVILKLGDKKWTGSLVYCAKNNAAMINRGGWKQFAVENKLGVGDACLFKLVSSDDEEPVVFDVQIFRAVPVDGDHVQAAALCTTTGSAAKESTVVNSNGS